MELIDHRVALERDAAVARIQDSLKPSDATDCEVCGDPIGAARLRVMPSATACIDCAEKAERT